MKPATGVVTLLASVAQWIRAEGFYPLCRGFESCRGHFLTPVMTWCLCWSWRVFLFLRGFQFWSVLACFGLRCSQNAVTEHTTITPPQTQKCPHPRPPKVKDEGIPQISTSSRIDSGTSGNRAVQSLLRHAKLDTTMVHVALDEESRRAAASVT